MGTLGHLHSRPLAAAFGGGPGRHALGFGSKRDSHLYVPASVKPSRPAPLALMLHGAGGHAEHGLGLMERLADDAGMIVLAPASRAQTWDVIAEGAYGADLATIDRALALVFRQYAVDPARIAIGGFSDGASYALSLGLANGDLFRHVIAFSPGFVAPMDRRGEPRLFIRHGRRDDVLPIEACSRRIVPNLREAGYLVDYREFDGPHVVPPELARAALAWFLPDAGG